MLRAASWFIHGTFSLCPHMVEGTNKGTFTRALMSFMRVPSSQRPHFFMHLLGVRISVFGLQGTQTFRHISGPLSRIQEVLPWYAYVLLSPVLELGASQMVNTRNMYHMTSAVHRDFTIQWGKVPILTFLLRGSTSDELNLTAFEQRTTHKSGSSQSRFLELQPATRKAAMYRWKTEEWNTDRWMGYSGIGHFGLCWLPGLTRAQRLGCWL
jgi:hypothetical protein